MINQTRAFLTRILNHACFQISYIRLWSGVCLFLTSWRLCSMISWNVHFGTHCKALILPYPIFFTSLEPIIWSYMWTMCIIHSLQVQHSSEGEENLCKAAWSFFDGLKDSSFKICVVNHVPKQNVQMVNTTQHRVQRIGLYFFKQQKSLLLSDKFKSK